MFESMIDRIESDERISVLATKLKGAAGPLVGDGVVRDVLTGRWFGHPAHPAVVMAPLAGWFAGPLHEGAVVDGCLECPWHGARFDIDTGQVRQGPASAAQPVYEVVDDDGQLSIRRDEHGSLRSAVTTA